MAQSPAHRLGQIIGDELEAAIRKPLMAIAEEFGLYLDYKHARPTRGGKKIVTWRDLRGNTHDLDYVLEEGGSEEALGRPRAFIEIAWRRYTKHSRNKAQEIQGSNHTAGRDLSELSAVLGCGPCRRFYRRVPGPVSFAQIQSRLLSLRNDHTSVRERRNQHIIGRRDQRSGTTTQSKHLRSPDVNSTGTDCRGNLGTPRRPIQLLF